MSAVPRKISLSDVRQHLYAAVVCDALDASGFPQQSPRAPLRRLTVPRMLVGRCRTTLWADMYHEDPRPYELELQAVDSCQPDDVLVAAAGGSLRSGIWGELLTTAARNGGCVGAIVDGAVRDVGKIRAMDFPVFARGTCLYDSQHRQRVIDCNVPVEIDGVTFSPGDLVVADEDGIVVVDYNWCIGCRYCEAACPYHARRFNWEAPQIPAEEINPDQGYLSNRIRPQGVMEKCTFCLHRTREGKMPACLEACPTGARVFGDLNDPDSAINYVLKNKRVFVLKEELGTKPSFFYFFD